MGDNLSILIKLKISDDISDLNKSILELSKNPTLQRLSLKVNIDDSEIQLLSNQIKQFQTQMSKSLNLNVNTTGGNSGLDKFTQKFETVAGQSQKLTQEITEFTNQAGQAVKVIDSIDKETQSVYKSTQLVTDSYKKQREAQQKLLDDFNNKNINGIDYAIKQRELEAQQFSTQLKAQMQQEQELAVEKQTTLELQNQITLFQKKMQLQSQSITGKYGSLVDSNSLNNLNSQINSLSTSTPDVANKMKTFSLGMKEIETNAKTSGSALKLAQQDAKSFSRELIGDIQKFSLWFGIGTMFMSVVHAIKNAISTVKLLDDSLLELNKVVSVTNQEMDSFVGRAYEAGELLARTGKDVIDATTVFAKAGFELEEAFNLGKEALLLTNIADGITNVEDAASSLIAVLRGYNMEASETAHIVDLLNEVSNKYAVDTDNLTDGLQRASGTLAMTGTSVEQLTGMLTGGYEALRNMEKVSSGLITISQRLRGVSESGEEIDGLMPKLQKAFKEYAGIDIQTQNGKLRSTFDILSDLQGVWSTLNEEQRQYLGELSSGVRQAPVLNAIIQNWKSVEGATESAINSLGSAEKENAKYLDSISGRVSKFSSSVQLMWSNTIDSDVIKFFVDLGTGIIKIVDSVGLLNTVLFATVTYFTFFKTSMLLAPIINLATAAITKLTIGLNLSTAAAITLNTVLGMLAPIAIATGIMAIVAGIKYLSEATERQQEVVRKLKEEYDTFSTSLEENESKQQKVIDRLQELYDLRNANKITDVEKDELTRLENVNTELQRQIEYEKALKAVKGEALERETLKLSNKKTLNYNARNNIGYVQLTVPDEIQNGIIDVKEYTTAIDELKTSYDNNEISAEDYGKKLEELEVLRSTQVAGISELITKLEEENKNYVGATEEGNKKKAANEVIIKSAKDFIVALSGEENALNALGIATSDGNKETQSYTQSLEEFNKSIDTAQSSLKDLNQILEDNGSLTSDQVLDLLETYPELLDKISKTTDGYKIQESALEDLRKQQIATALDSITSQITEAENVKTQTEKKLEQYGFEIQKLKDIASAKAALAKLAQQEALTYANASSGAETNEMLREKRYSSAYKSSLASSGYAELSEYEKIVAELDELSKKKGVYTDLLNDKGLGLGEGSSGGKEYTPSTEQQALSDLLAANKISYEEYYKRLLALEKSQYSDYANKSASQLEDMLRSKNEKIAKRTEEYLSLTTEISSTKNTILENTLSSLSDEYDDGKISIDKYISSLEALRKQGGLTAEQLKNINDTIEDLSKTQQESAQNMATQIINIQKDIAQSNLDAFKDASDIRIEGYQAEIDKLEEQNDLIDEQQERQEKLLAIQEAQIALTNAQNNKSVQTLKKNADGSWNYEYVADQQAINSALDDLKKAQEDYIDWERNVSLKKQKKYWEDLIKQEEEAQKEQERLFNLHYENIELLATAYLDTLKTIYGDKWDEIIALQEEKLLALQTTQAALLDVSVANSLANSNASTRNGISDNDLVTVNQGVNGRAVQETVASIEARQKIRFDAATDEEWKKRIRRETEAATGRPAPFDFGGEAYGIGYLPKNIIKPERVLSPEQTVNFNKLIASLPNLLKSINISNMLIPKIISPNFSGLVNKTAQTVTQVFQIDNLTFPNVSSSSEIEKAISNLPLHAKVRAYTK